MKKSSGEGARTKRAALIIAGGRGTRFWPAARAERPKPTFRFNGDSTLIADTIKRILPLFGDERIFVLVPTSQHQAFAAAIGNLLPADNLLLEPASRGTAVAIAWGHALVKKRLGPVTLAVLPADHYVKPDAGFRRTIEIALRLAERHRSIVVIGVTPTRPETGYGYQHLGKPVAGGGFELAGFVEKPPLARARQMQRSGKYLWNAGIFVMTGETLQAGLERHCPALPAAIGKMEEMPAGWDRRYSRLKFDSFDYEVLERASNVLAVRARFEWYDVGSWQGAWEALRDRQGNALSGSVLSLDSRGILARSDARLLVMLGVEDLVVIDSGDAVLVTTRARSQEVRKVVDLLEKRGLHRFL